MNNKSVREMWKLASKWRRYRGYPHGYNGGIDVPAVVALDASQKMPRNPSGYDKIASKIPGMYSGPFAYMLKHNPITAR